MKQGVSTPVVAKTANMTIHVKLMLKVVKTWFTHTLTKTIAFIVLEGQIEYLR